MLVPTWMGTNMADGNQQKHMLPRWSCLIRQENFLKFVTFFNLHNSTLGVIRMLRWKFSF